MKMPKAQNQAPAVLSGWQSLIVTTFMQVLISGGALTPPVFATEATVDLAIPVSWIGFYTSLVYLGATLSSPASGDLITRYGSIRTSQFCLVMVGIGLLLIGLSDFLSVWAVLVAAVMIGLGYGPITPASSHLLAKTTAPHRRGLVFSLKQTGVPLGGMVAGAAIPTLVLWQGWQGASLMVGTLVLLAVGVVQFSQRTLDGPPPLRGPMAVPSFKRTFQPVLMVWRHPRLRYYACASFTFTAMQLSLGTFLVSFLVQEKGMSLILAGAILSLSQGGGVIGRILWGYVGDRWLGAHGMLLCLALVMTACGALALTIPKTFGSPASTGDLWLIGLWALIFGASAIGWNGVFLGEVAHHVPTHQAGQATGGVLFYTYAGVVFGPSVFGVLVAPLGSYAAAFAALSTMTAIGGILLAIQRQIPIPQGENPSE